MILEKQKEANVMAEGDSQESIGMSLDLDSAQILMQMLSKNLYSDAIGSTIRECASNALDSHRRAKVNEPIHVALKIVNSAWEFSVEDFGIGLDADDVRNIISKYGKSTKRDSANELGMMGLGFKAPLAYCSSFYFVCRKGGMERKYMMYEGEDVNTIDMLYEQPTRERNGVKIIVPVKHHDVYSFKTKIKEQLAYFESVFFDCGDLVDNSFQIIRHEHFQFSPLSSDHYLHICLDNVYYSLDFNKLGINGINFPIALRFGLSDGIFPTPNRESIRYTKEAKDAILAKLKAVADFFVDKYNETVKESDDVISVFNYYANNSRQIALGTNRQLDVEQLKPYASKQFAKPKIKGIKVLDIKRVYDRRDYILDEFKVKFQLQNGKLYSRSGRHDGINFWDILHRRHKFYIQNDKLAGIKKDWIRATFPGGATLVKKEKEFKLGKWMQTGNGDNMLLRNLLDLDKYQKYHWRTVITEFRMLLDMLMKDWQDIDKMDVPTDFIDARKKATPGVVYTPTGKKARRKKLTGEVIGKEAANLERYVQGNNCKWVPKTYQMAEAHKAPFLMVYGSQDDARKMDKLYEVMNRQKVKLAIFSQRELNVLNKIDLHNWISMDKFMKGDHIVVKRVVTAYLIHKFMSDYNKVFENRSIFTEVSTDFYKKMQDLYKYEDKHLNQFDEKFMNELAPLMEEQGLVDLSIYGTYKEMKALFEKLTFLNPLFNGIGYVGHRQKELSNVVADLFKYYKQKVNLDKYHITLNEQPAAEQETIDELINL